jgi:uncharacterized protein (DUF427 family)
MASYCAYKGRASYFSVPDGPSELAWTYREPFREQVAVIVDGQRCGRPVPPWSG